jgi:hypothetical protein
VIGVGIKEQIRRIQNPHAVAIHRAGSGDVQAIDEGFVFVEFAVAVGVFVNGDFVERRDNDWAEAGGTLS